MEQTGDIYVWFDVLRNIWKKQRVIILIRRCFRKNKERVDVWWHRQWCKILQKTNFFLLWSTLFLFYSFTVIYVTKRVHYIGIDKKVVNILRWCVIPGGSLRGKWNWDVWYLTEILLDPPLGPTKQRVHPNWLLLLTFPSFQTAIAPWNYFLHSSRLF